MFPSDYNLRLSLSALLAEATSDPVYLQAATESADFIQAHLVNDAKIVADTVAAAKIRNCEHNDIRASYNSGLAIQGLAVLTSITNSASTRVLSVSFPSAASFVY
jgi:predicted alpha-1,6-mannanase (GH76 family)